MRTRHLLTAIASLSVVALLSGCTPAKPYDKTATSTSSPTPVFASEEEALAAAEEVYRSYLAMSDLIAQEGGVDPERIDPYVVGEFRESTLAGLTNFQSNGYRSVGNTLLDSFKIQVFDSQSSDETLIAYACQDISGVDVVDTQGVSVVKSGRINRLLLEVTFASTGETFRIAAQEPWGDGQC